MHWNPFTRFWRFYKVTRLASKLMKQGYIVFSPISHCYPMHFFSKMPGDWKFWSLQDESHLDHCDILYVYQLPGWVKSKGVHEEIAYATRKFKEIVYIKHE